VCFCRFDLRQNSSACRNILGKILRETLFIQNLGCDGANAVANEFLEVFWRDDFVMSKQFIGHIFLTTLWKIEGGRLLRRAGSYILINLRLRSKESFRVYRCNSSIAER
jgi:hypothetical protein